MSLTFKPFEQVAAELQTLIAVKIGAKSNADLVARSEAALAVSAVFTALGTGNATDAQAAFKSLVNVSADPGVTQVVTDLLNVGNDFLQTQLNINAAIPLLGAEAEAIATNIGAGMASVANSYITKYGATANDAAQSKAD